jgi:hypothetical protein
MSKDKSHKSRVDTVEICCKSFATETKGRQRTKIQELRVALNESGFCTLDDQAEALGLCRSTTWAILRGNHKASGLSMSIIKRILQSQRLPPAARTKIIEYVEEKSAGQYGDGELSLRKFKSRLRDLCMQNASSDK